LCFRVTRWRPDKRLLHEGIVRSLWSAVGVVSLIPALLCGAARTQPSYDPRGSVRHIDAADTRPLTLKETPSKSKNSW
jgi:hypothetical protein